MEETLRENWNELTDSAEVNDEILVVFSDYECPVCARQEREIQEFMRLRPQVRVVYKNFPLSIHARAVDAAVLQTCAEEQRLGEEVHRSLFQDRRWVGEGSFAVIESLPGLDRKILQGCLDSGRGLREVEKERRLGDALSIRGTPSFVIPGRARVHGFRTADNLSDLF